MKAGDDWQTMTQMEADQDPVFQGRTELHLALLERRAEGDHSFQLGNLTGESAVFQFVVPRQLHPGLNGGGERKCHGEKLPGESRVSSSVSRHGHARRRPRAQAASANFRWFSSMTPLPAARVSFYGLLLA